MSPKVSEYVSGWRTNLLHLDLDYEQAYGPYFISEIVIRIARLHT